MIPQKIPMENAIAFFPFPFFGMEALLWNYIEIFFMIEEKNMKGRGNH
jgi:hypothetical protein